MKIKHKAMSIITSIILAIITLILSIILSFNFKNPTLLLTNYLSEISNIEDVELSFSSIDKNLNKIVLNDINFSYNDEKVIKAEKLELKQGLISIIKTILIKKGTIMFTFSGLDININDSLITSFTTKLNTKTSTSSDNDSALYDFDIILNTDSAKISYLPYTSFEFDVKLKLEELKELKYLYLNIDKNFKVTYLNHNLAFSDLSVSYTDNIKLSTNSFTYKTDDALVNAQNIEIKTTTIFDEIEKNNVNLNFSSLSASYKDHKIKAGSTNIKYYDLSSSGDIANISLDSFASLNTNNINFKLDYKEDTGLNSKIKFFDNINFEYDEMEADISPFTLDLKYHDNISIETVIANFKLNIEGKESVFLTNSILSYNKNDVNNISLSSAVKIDNIHEAINEAKFDLDTNIKIGDKLESAKVKVQNLDLPHISKLINAEANYGETSSFVLDFNKELVINANYDEKLDLNIDFNELELFEFKYFFEKYANLISSYIGQEVRLNGNINVASDTLNDYKYSHNLNLDDLKFRNYLFDLNSDTQMKIENDELFINKFKIYNDLVDFNIDAVLNEKDIVKTSKINLKVKNQNILDISSHIVENGYKVNLTSKILENLSFDTLLSFDTINLISSDAVISKKDFYFPVKIFLNLEDNIINLTSDELNIYGEFGSNILLDTSFNNFEIPIRNQKIKIDGNIKHIVDYENQTYSLVSPIFKINNTDFKVDFNQDVMTLDDIN